MESITFKPYATGTMNQPYIDCAVRLSKKGINAEDVTDVLCETAEGYVHRLWDPLEAKQRPANEYAAKFSTPFNIAVAFITGGAGLAAFTEETVRDPRILALARKVRYVVDPEQSVSESLHGPHAHDAQGRQGDRGAAAAHPRRRARAAVARRDRGQVQAQRRVRRLDKARADAFLASVPKFFDGPLDVDAAARLTAPRARAATVSILARLLGSIGRRRTPPPTLHEIFQRNHVGTSTEWHHYFDSLRALPVAAPRRPLTLLEIGVNRGGSLRMWRDYFGPSARIYGMDVNPACAAFEKDGVRIFIGDQADRDFLRQVKADIGELDVVIDDGGHKMSQQINSFEELYPATRQLYLVEDTHSSYWKRFLDMGSMTFIEYAKQKVDALHEWHRHRGSFELHAHAAVRTRARTAGVRILRDDARRAFLRLDGGVREKQKPASLARDALVSRRQLRGNMGPGVSSSRRPSSATSTTTTASCAPTCIARCRTTCSRRSSRSFARMGELAGGELYRQQLADRENEPRLTQWDAWGNRIDRIEVTPLWRKAERIAAEHGLVATAYERVTARSRACTSSRSPISSRLRPTSTAARSR